MEEGGEEEEEQSQRCVGGNETGLSEAGEGREKNEEGRARVLSVWVDRLSLTVLSTRQ
ncbi:hypothetical protein DACRYDRAFT_20238 [Dacryopinax primogenitus]|uniref:Uncharacterized protein n=1 Tax=Dacryopinax primogenitus (strain DJM 731) TaxID=1858805 RepID=M5GAM4_DACPD|nr:uncharacterized protein DACRYDRAFT_20238 [Dacryopinax primogenitus]EJU05914.1 hypothetical protein DACRYDRAFT_20238 [Dacryopinax primogenitus]